MINCGLCNGVFTARFLQLDTAATATTTATSAGYDNVLNEPNLVSSGADDPIGFVGRVDVQHDVRCQLEVTQASDRLRQTQQGKARSARYEVTVDRRTLDGLGLIDTNGESKIRTGAKLERILDRAGVNILAFPDPPGLYVEEIIYDAWMDPAFAIVVYICTPKEQAL